MDLQSVSSALKKRGYETSCFKTAAEAAGYLNSQVNGRIVGFGDSETLNSLGLFDLLVTHNEVYDPQHQRPGMDFYSTAKQCMLTDIFFTSVNAMAETGEMVNIDGTGNRVAGSLFGHEKVYFVVGRNKIAPTLEEARWRARNVAAPMNTARHHYSTPCAIKQDHCYDCKSPQRICNAEVVYLHRMNRTTMEVVLIDEDLGF